MEAQRDYEARVDAQLELCDSRIAELESKLKQASPELQKEYENEISSLILNREALKRGLLDLGDEGDRGPCSAP